MNIDIDIENVSELSSKQMRMVKAMCKMASEKQKGIISMVYCK